MQNHTKICGLYHLRDIDDLRLRINNRINSLSDDNLRFLYNAYNPNVYYQAELDYKFDRLSTYEGILKNLKDQVLNGNDICLSRNSLQSLVEKVNNILGGGRIRYTDYEIDDSREEEWVFNNPFCRTYEDWEKWAKIICGKLQLELNFETEKINNLILEITREIITPNILLAISAYTEARQNLKLEINRSDEEIKLDFELLIEKLPTFDLSLDIYVEMIKEHKLSFDIIKTVYDEGLSLQLGSEEVELKTPVNAYSLEQISGNINPSYLKKFGMETSINKKDLLQDYK